jgi:hypothetical protein
MGRKKKQQWDYPTGQLLNFARDSYLERTSRPVYAILFLLPFIIFYEIGTILINTDVLTRYQLRVVVILIGLQVASKKQWYFCLSDYLPMALECVLLAVPLIVLSLLSNSPSARPDNLPRPQSLQPPAQVQMAARTRVISPEQIMAALGQQDTAHPRVHSLLANVVTGVGAGIYEELVFRLILICVLMVLFQDLIGLSHQNAIALSVLMSAALFSAHHHIIWIDGRLARSAPFNWTEFGFRTIAGIYFALLFAIRGFGITAGTHAFYDIIATLVNAIFFDH